MIDDHRAAHLHLLPAGSPRWAEQLAFRDALRADPELAHRYAQLKRALAIEHATDREAYQQARQTSSARSSTISLAWTRGEVFPSSDDFHE